MRFFCVQVKKLRILHNRKYKYKAEVIHSENTSASGSGSIGGENENQSEAGDDKVGFAQNVLKMIF